MIRRLSLLVLTTAGFALAASCTSESPHDGSGLSDAGATPLPSLVTARAEIGKMRALFPSVDLASSHTTSEKRVSVRRREHADDTLVIGARDADVTIGVRLRGAPSAARVEVDGVASFPGSGLVELDRDGGVEDHVFFATRPSEAHAVYALDVTRVAGLRLVDGNLEALDAKGAPRVRMEAPYVVGAKGAHVAANVRIEGCSFDTSPAAPWDRPVVAPGASTCIMHISWPEVAYPALLDPSWVAGGFDASRDQHVAVKLASGRVLIAYGESCGGGCLPSNGARLFDPATNTFAATANTGLIGRAQGIPGVALANGKAFVLTSGSILYDPATGNFTNGPTPLAAHGAATLTALASGKVLVAGGAAGVGADLYTPATASFVLTGGMVAAHDGHAAALLRNGKVLIVGGGTATAELYDPAVGANGTFAATGSMAVARTGHVAVTLLSGKVLVVGGGSATAEVYDPATGKFTPAGSLLDSRTELQANLLPSGSVYVTGGFLGLSSTSLVERFDPAIERFVLGPALTRARGWHRATNLDDGSLLVTGGRSRPDGFGGSIAEAERLTATAPGQTCATNDDCGSGTCDRGICCASACTGACRKCVAGTGACEPVVSADDLDTCTGASTCDAAGTCKKKNGQACTGTAECSSGQCVDGFCCNVACGAVCEACDGVVKGRCDVVAGKAHGDRVRSCANDGTQCGGACDGIARDACRFPTSSTGCGTSCSEGVRTASACDGKGTCASAAPQPCPGNFACADANVCKVTCATDTDCGRFHACEAGKCIPAAKCDGDHRIVAPDGRTATDCAPYRCDVEANVCRTSCTDVGQCSDPFFCNPDGQCVTKPAATVGCATGPGGSSPDALVLVGVVAACVASRRRSRRSSAP